MSKIQQLKLSKIILLLLITCHWLGAFTIPFSEKPVKTDENLCTGFFNGDNDDSLKCEQENNAWFWHNGEKLFMLWEAEIDSTFGESSFRKRDDFSTENYVRLQIITDVNKCYAYIFYAYPLGGRTDGIRTEDMNIDGGWNSGYTYKNQITDKKWTCNMEIPFKDLRFQGNEPYNWKIILSRYDKYHNIFYISPYLRINLGKDYFRKATDIVIGEKIADNRNILFRPYYLKKYDIKNNKFSPDPSYDFDKNKLNDLDNIGFDFSYNPNNAIKAKLSVNPDFSDVPLDRAQNTFNMRNDIYLEENRYFFNEDLDAFGVGSNLFYSRNIMQPNYALKVTGSTPSCSYGFLSSMDKEIKVDGEITNRDDFFHILAYKPTMDNLGIQFTFLNRENKDYHADVFHIAPSFTFNQNHSVWSEFNYSYFDDGISEIKRGFNAFGGYNGYTRQCNWSLGGGIVSEDFKAGMGRADDVGFYYPSYSFGWKDESPSEFIRSYGYNTWSSISFYTANDEMRYLNSGVNFWMDTQYKFSYNFGGNFNQDNFTGTRFNVPNYSFNANYSNWEFLNIGIYAELGEMVIYELNDKYFYDITSASASGKINKYSSYSVSAIRFSYHGFPEGSDCDDEYWVGNAGTTINFTNEISLTNGLRYNNYGDIDGIGFFSNFRWEFRPDCNFFAGYSTAGDNSVMNNYVSTYEQSYVKINYSF